MLEQAMSGTNPEYRRVSNGDADVEAGGSNYATNMSRTFTDTNNPIRKDRSKIFQEEQEKVARVKPGIPVPTRPAFRFALCFRWMIILLLFAFLFYQLIRRLTTQELLLVKEDVSEISLSMQNCDFQSIPLDPDLGYGSVLVLTVQHWNFMGSSSIRKGPGHMEIDAKMRLRLNMFRCLVSLSVPPDHVPDKLTGYSSGQDMSRFMIKVAPAKNLDFKMQETYFEATALPEKLKLSALHGSMVLIPEKLTGAHEVAVKTKYAVMQFETPAPMSLTFGGMAASTSIMSSKFIKSTSGGVILGNSANDAPPQLKVSYSSDKDTPGFFSMGKMDHPENLHVKKGKLQSLKQPLLTNESKHDMEELSEWIKDMGSTTAPWVARVKLRGPGHQPGVWYGVSSEAFLALPLELFVLLSAGSLHPAVRDTSVQLLSIDDTWPPSELAKEYHTHVHGLTDADMWQVFFVLKDYFLTSAKTTIAWVPTEGTPIVFTRTGQKWRNYYVDLTKKQSLLFLVALLLNTMASAAFATVVIYKVRTSSGYWNSLHNMDVNIASSHRVARRLAVTATSGGGWQLQATQVDWPDHGVLLRWRKRTGTQRASYLSIEAKTTESFAAAGFEEHDVWFTVLADKVPAMKDHSVICEFLFSIAGVAFSKGYEPKHEPLNYQHIYKFQVMGYNASDDYLGESAWSNEVFIAPRSSVFDYPFLILKTFFQIPTSSLGFYIDCYARRHIDGKIGQQLVVLKNMQITYHKNYSDFEDADSEFYLTVYSGDDLQKCKDATDKGRCITYSQTDKFKPLEAALDPTTGLTDDRDGGDTEQDRLTQPIPGELRVGTLKNDRDEQAIVMSMRTTNGEDVAESKVLWEDLMEAFENVDDDPDYTQAIFFNLTVGKDVTTYNEDYLVWFKSLVSFENSIDAECVELQREQRFFSMDSAGQIFYQGMERFITWDQESELMTMHSEFHLYLKYPMHSSVEPKMVADNVSKSSVGVSFMVEFPEQVSNNHVVAEVEVHDTVRDEVIEGVVSHRFIICRTWTLADFELSYAAFCKMNNMVMEHLTADVLDRWDLSLTKIALKVIPKLRKPLQFEEHETANQQIVLHSEDMFIIGSRAIQTITKDAMARKQGDTGAEVDDRASSDHGSSAAKKTLIGGSSADESRASSDQVVGTAQVYRPTSQPVDCLEHIWPKTFTWHHVGHGTGWVPSFLLMYCFYPVDNIIDAMVWLAEVFQMTRLFHNAQSAFGSYAVDQILGYLLAPLYWILPFLAESMLFLIQLVMYMGPPLLLLVVALVYEYLRSSMEVAFDFLSDASKIQAHIPDLVFTRQVSERGLHTWLTQVNQASLVTLVGCVGTVSAILLLIFESNFCRNALPWRIQATCHAVFNSIGTTIISLYGWFLCAFASMIVLWFIMAVVIYPEQMLTAIICVAGVGFVLFKMYSKFRLTEEQIRMFLRDEIPDILDLVCDNFLADFEKDRAARLNQLERQRVKCDDRFWKFMQQYLRDRFSSNDNLSKRFRKLLNEAHPSTCVHKIFDHALIKEKHWDQIDLRDADAEQSPFPPTPATPSGGSAQGAYEFQEVHRTDVILANIGLEQHDTSGEQHFSLRQRLLDRETESGGEMVHTYSKELREKLMKVFVRMLDEQTFESDMKKILEDWLSLAQAMHRAHKVKLKLFEQSADGALMSAPSGASARGGTGSESSSANQTLLELLIQYLHKQKMRKLYEFIAEHLEDVLDPGEIAAHVTPFIEKRIPDEIKKQLRLTLDEHTVGSAMQQVIERLRRWMGRMSQEEMVQHLTLEANTSNRGLKGVLINIGVLHENCTPRYWNRFFGCLERTVHAFKKDDVTEAVVDSADIEEFVQELLGATETSQGSVKRLWWGALKEFLQRVGFPMSKNGAGNTLSEKQVMREYEDFAMRDTTSHPFLPEDQVIDFLSSLTRGSTSDGAAGRLWKAQVIALMQEVGICGHIDMTDQDGARRSREGKTKLELSARELAVSTESHHTGEFGMADMSGLPGYANYQWPKWLDRAWNEVVPFWSPDKDSPTKTESASRSSGLPQPFMPKTDIYRFLDSVAYSKQESQKPKGLKFEEVNEEYDKWFKCTDTGKISLWTKRGRSFYRLRGIWPECFLGVLGKMDNGIEDQIRGLKRFAEARSEFQGRHQPVECEGIMDIHEFEDWLTKNVVEVTSEVSKEVFIQVLKRANISIPPIVAEYLWLSADDNCSHSSLRRVKDLEDRLVMYLSKGLVVESVRSLIFDELQVPALQQLRDTDVKSAFDQVDDKTGQCGFLEPHEVQQMIRLIAQEGMTLDMLSQTFDRLKLHFPEKDVKAAFLMMDTNSDDVIDMPEFLGMVDYFIVSLIPNQIFGALGLQVQQIGMKLLGALIISLIVLLFILISLGAFQVGLSGRSKDGASWVRAGIALAAVAGLKGDASEDNQDKLYFRARQKLYDMMGVSSSQMEMRRRSNAAGVAVAKQPESKMPKFKPPKAMKKRGGGSGGRHEDKDDEDDDEDDD